MWHKPRWPSEIKCKDNKGIGDWERDRVWREYWGDRCVCLSWPLCCRVCLFSQLRPRQINMQTRREVPNFLEHTVTSWVILLFPSDPGDYPSLFSHLSPFHKILTVADSLCLTSRWQDDDKRTVFVSYWVTNSLCLTSRRGCSACEWHSQLNYKFSHLSCLASTLLQHVCHRHNMYATIRFCSS